MTGDSRLVMKACRFVLGRGSYRVVAYRPGSCRENSHGHRLLTVLILKEESFSRNEQAIKQGV